MEKIPRIVHFVFGLKEQFEPFHLLHYLAMESCRRLVQPDRILLHYHHLPFGLYWDLIRPQLELHPVKPIAAVDQLDYDASQVSPDHRYAHHADFVRLDALLEHGGIYADIDTLFLQPFPDHLFDHEFVIGREAPLLDPHSGTLQDSLCNALMLARPGARFVSAWREQMADALDGSWSNHSCQLAQRLADQHPDWVHIEPERSFMGVPLSREGLESFLENEPPNGEADLANAYSVHLWQHAWWDQDRNSFCRLHERSFSLNEMHRGTSQFCRLARQFLPTIDPGQLDGLAG